MTFLNSCPDVRRFKESFKKKSDKCFGIHCDFHWNEKDLEEIENQLEKIDYWDEKVSKIKSKINLNLEMNKHKFQIQQKVL